MSPYAMIEGRPVVFDIEEIVPLAVSDLQVKILRDVIYWSHKQGYWLPFRVGWNLIEALERRDFIQDISCDEGNTWQSMERGQEFIQWYTQQEANGMKDTGPQVLYSGVECYVEKGQVFVEVPEVVQLEVTAAQVKVLREVAGNFRPYGVYANKDLRRELCCFALARRGLLQWTDTRYDPRENEDEYRFEVTDKGCEFLQWLDEQEG